MITGKNSLLFTALLACVLSPTSSLSAEIYWLGPQEHN